jgi:hypothetical protein
MSGFIGALRGSNRRLASVADGRDDCADGTISTAMENARGTPDEIDRSGADAIDETHAHRFVGSPHPARPAPYGRTRISHDQQFEFFGRRDDIGAFEACATGRNIAHDRADGGSCSEFDRRRKLALNADPIAHIRLVHSITPQAFDQTI